MTGGGLTMRVGTRESQLAMIQTRFVVELLKKIHPGHTFEIISMKTTGDKILDKTLSKIGEKSLFTKELETALLDNTVDFVVHSLKDLPTSLPDDLVIGSILEREQPWDSVVMRKESKAKSLADLPPESLIGTSSLRRIAQLRKKYPDLKFCTIRGNLNTRLRKLDDDGACEALILAEAGLKRMKWNDRITYSLTEDECLHAVGQGAIAVECRQGDDVVLELLSQLNHEETILRCVAERSAMKALEGGCSVPLGVTSKYENNILSLKVGVFSLNGEQCLIKSSEQKIHSEKLSERKQKCDIGGILCPFSIKDDAIQMAEKLGKRIAAEMLKEGAAEILKKAREDAANTNF